MFAAQHLARVVGAVIMFQSVQPEQSKDFKNAYFLSQNKNVPAQNSFVYIQFEKLCLIG